jgi:hypothetical protein
VTGRKAAGTGLISKTDEINKKFTQDRAIKGINSGKLLKNALRKKVRR